MTDRSVGPRCGNNPNTRLTPGDRKAVDDFKARLALQADAKPYIERAAWVDFDPLMEVIAATVWEHCARDDEEMPQLVRDDPRTIAAFAAAVARANAATVRCGSCEHESQYHDVDGRCWFTVEQGVTGRDAVCSCLLRRVAAESAPADTGHDDSETLPDGEPTESVIYQVVGDWGVDSADSAEGARAAVAKWLRAYPKCGAHAQQRIVRDWPDGSEFYGPWTDLPEQPAAARQPKEA